MNMRVTTFLAAAFTSLACSVSAYAAEDWHYTLTPYIWLPTIKGNLSYSIPPGGGGSPNIDAGPSDYLSDIKFALMLTGEARRGQWSVFGDYIYLNIDGATATTVSVNLPGGGTVPVVDTGSETSMKGTLITLAPGYSVYSTPQVNLDMFAGVRNLHINAAVDWSISGPVGAFPATGSTSQSKDVTNGIIGVRGHVHPGDSNWSMPYYLDVGTGNSDFTWQALVGASYAYGWGDVSFNYRYLKFNAGSNQLVDDLVFRGPMLGATFHF
jgi:hypothetical protein